MYLIVGLGNPGSQYVHTRHNAGFDALDALAQKTGTRIAREKESALVGECFIAGQKTILAKPQTFMNLSGFAVSRLVNWYRIEPERLLVVYDDIVLAPGVLRLRKNGSAGTHNGMRSIIGELGYSNFPRLRIGVGAKDPNYDLADWVLSHYRTPKEQRQADECFARAADAVIEYISNGIRSAMNAYNTPKKRKPTEEAGE